MQNIGERIKQLRKYHNVTQQQLGAFLSVSYQAVSKWETGTTLPEITQLVKIAEFFGVSTDYLLGVSRTSTNSNIENVLKQVDALRKNGKNDDAVKLLKQTLSQYPNNFALLAELIETKINTYSPDCNQSQWLADICEKSYFLLDNCTDDALRYKVKTSLVFAYSFCDKRKKAEQILSTFPDFAYTKAEMYSMIAPPKKRVKYKKKCLLCDFEKTFTDMLAVAIHHFSFGNPADALHITKTVTEVINAIGKEGILLFYSAEALCNTAIAYAKLQDTENTLNYVKCAFYEYLRFDTAYVGEQVYSAPLLSGETYNNSETTYSNGQNTSLHFLLLLTTLRSFDFIRNNPDFAQLIEIFKSECEKSSIDSFF